MDISPDLNRRIDCKIAEIDAVAKLLPGVIIIHQMPGFRLKYMSPNGLHQLGISLEEFRSLSVEEYHDTYFNPDDSKDYIPKVQHLIESNLDDDITFFQQVRVGENGDWVWHMNSMKILMRDDEGLPLLTLAMAFRVDPLRHITTKVSRLLEENDFLRKNYAQFSKLSKRECDILKLQTLGKSSQEIADELFISVTTVETHRKNIKQKLKVQSSYELSQYARAFDLI